MLTTFLVNPCELDEQGKVELPKLSRLGSVHSS